MKKREPNTVFGNAVDGALALLPPAAFAATVAIGLLLASSDSATAGSVDVCRAGTIACSAYFSPLSP